MLLRAPLAVRRPGLAEAAAAAMAYRTAGQGSLSHFSCLFSACGVLAAFVARERVYGGRREERVYALELFRSLFTIVRV